jgi:hypothetical protein
MGGVVRKVTGGSKPTTYTASKPADVTTTAAAKGTEDTEVSDIETESTTMQKKKKGKKALTLSPAAANVGGEGASGLNIPTS